LDAEDDPMMLRLTLYLSADNEERSYAPGTNSQRPRPEVGAEDIID
jgi:hypothetical protein